MNVSVVAVPAVLAVILSYVFQDAKPLLEHVPGLRPTDATHNDGLRLVYAALAFLAVAGYALYTGGVPANVDAAGSLLLSCLVTAGSMTGVAHIVYTKLNSGGADASAAPSAPDAPNTPPDFPPGAPSVQALGLPTAAEAASEPAALAA